MSSLTSALSVAQNGLGVIEQQISITSDNITNANKPGYTRETFTPDFITSGTVTQAVGGQINSAIDANLDSLIINQNSDTQQLGVINTYLQAYDNNLGSTDSTSSTTLSAGLSSLNSAISSLASNPSLSSAKSTVVVNAQNIASQLNGLSADVQNARLAVNQQIGTSVTTVNTTLDDLASLNAQFGNATANTNLPALENQQNQDLQTLSGLMGIQYNYGGNNQLQIYTTSGELLVAGSTANHLSYTPSPTMSSQTTYPAEISGITVQGRDITDNITTGALGGLVQLRDTIFPNEQDKLDTFATTLQNTVNAAVNAGASIPSRTTVTGSATVSLGDAFSSNVPSPSDITVALTDSKGTVQGTSGPIDISAFGSVNDVVTALNGIPGITATINNNGNLSITSTNPSYGISINDAGTSVGSNSQGFSDYFGLNNLFDSTRGASDIHVSSYLQSNPAYLAVGTLNTTATVGTAGITAGDNSAMNAAYTALTNPVSIGAAGDFPAQTATLSNYVSAIIAGVATSASNALTQSTNSQSILAGLQSTSSNENGVNIDQETADSVALENSYNATAKIISTVAAMFQSLLQAIT